MRARSAFLVVVVLLAAFPFGPSLHAQPLVNIETVLVGDPNNSADVTGYGSVPYIYRIGKFEVTIAQYVAFLNAVAKADPYGLYDVNMASDTYFAGISRSGSPGSYSYSSMGPLGLTPPGASSAGNRPINYVSWFDVARFCNWLHNGATNGASTETGAYTLAGATSGNTVLKNPSARWWIPTENEWYKAAYYKGGTTNAGYWLYPTRSDVAPGNNINALAASNQANYRINNVYCVTQVAKSSANQNYLTEVGAFINSASPYGTYDQGGNLFEWNNLTGEVSGSGGARGSHCLNAVSSAVQSLNNLGPLGAGDHYDYMGFRLATAASNVTTNIVLAVEKNTSLSNQWQFEREINVGPMTNTNEFYRLKIRAVVE